MRHQAIILRVDRNAAGARIPFDKIYFFKREAQEHLSRVFRCALVVVPTKPFIEMVKNTIQTHSCKVGKVYPMKRRDEEQSLQMMKDALPIHNIVDNYKNYVGLVPMLYLQNDSKPKEIQPQYMRATAMKPKPGSISRRGKKGVTAQLSIDRAHANMRSMFQDTFTARSYFIMDGEKYQPVCTGCPNSLAMVTGQCNLGDRECLEKLSQVNRSNFRINMTKYLDWLKNVGEPELQLETENE